LHVLPRQGRERAPCGKIKRASRRKSGFGEARAVEWGGPPDMVEKPAERGVLVLGERFRRPPLTLLETLLENEIARPRWGQHGIAARSAVQRR
jgi:hypothetical protein